MEKKEVGLTLKDNEYAVIWAILAPNSIIIAAYTTRKAAKESPLKTSADRVGMARLYAE